MDDIDKQIFKLKKHWEENEELKPVIVDMSNDGAPNQVTKPDIEEDQRRWLIISLCLHNVVSPALRTYVRPIVETEYNNFKKLHNIYAQQFPNYLKIYPPTNKDMNYECINNNKRVRKVKKKPDVANFDLCVKDAVDFSKLFMQTHMAHYTGFDDTCDQSALLGIIANMDPFPKVIKTVADKLRTEVRNPWAHVNFTEWDTVKYQTCFQLMTQVIKNMTLPRDQEIAVLNQLTNWELNGMQLLKGTTIGLELLERITKETKALATYIRGMGMISDDNFETSRNAIDKISLLLVSSVQELKQKNAELESRADKQETIMQQLSTNVDDVKSAVAQSDDKINQMLQKVEGMAKEIQETQNDINTLKRNMSHDRPPNMPFFYPPNRLQNFIGRDFELNELETNFASNKEKVYTQVICGLGGIGKTTIGSEYAWRSADFYEGGIFWIDAENNESIANSIQKLAIDTGTTGQNAQETLHKTTRWLSMLQQKWLLVIDNVDADDISGVISELLLGSWKRESKGHLLITTRRESAEAEEDFQVSTDCCLTLEVFTPQESINFMQIRTGLDVKNELSYVKSIIEELGGLPLALEQAAAHIKGLKKCSFKEYLEKFKNQRLKFLKVRQRSKARLAVQTTWELNFEYVEKHSDESDVGDAAVALMYISAFLFADDIPQALMNVGSPENITDENLCKVLNDDIGPKQIMEILTRFSLFQQRYSDSVSVHRLVQEIVREKVMDQKNQKNTLRNAARMIHFALSHCKSPEDVLKSDSIERGSLGMWNRLALHANVLQTYILNFSRLNADELDVCFNMETAYLLQTSAIYHSLFQRQGEALAAQDQMLSILVNTRSEVPDKICRDLTFVKIPLLSEQKLLIENATSAVITDSRHREEENEPLIAVDVDGLRIKGNEEFKEGHYSNAIQYYTEIVRSTSKTKLDSKILSNRSLAYFKNKDYQKALKDADESIQIDPTNWKAYCWKAYSIAELIRLGQLEQHRESVGLAAASIAGYFNKNCLKESKLKRYYPLLGYKMVTNGNELVRKIINVMDMPNTTLQLKKGVFTFDKVEIINSVQIIGIEDSVEINAKNFLQVSGGMSKNPSYVYFENVTFVENSGHVVVIQNAVATFFRCTFRNGKKPCENYPKCDGNVGCRNERKEKCSKHFKSKEKKHNVSGFFGQFGVVAHSGGKVYLENCKLIQNGVGGALSHGKGSIMNVQNCQILKMPKVGVSARNGGTATVIGCEIRENKFHGVGIGPMGTGFVSGNTISDNGLEGIRASGILDDGENAGSICTITENIICNNGMSGITFFGGIYTVRGNRIFDNWSWGILVDCRSSVNIENNDIFKNKCGGVRIGINYSAVVCVDGNTIRDHTGPGLFAINLHEKDPCPPDVKKYDKIFTGMLEDEVEHYSVPPLITTRNIFRDNDRVQHPHQMMELVQTCCQCGKPSGNIKCERCKKAAYCSKECQTEHWRKHKHMCEILVQEYNIDIQMCDTKDTKEAFRWTWMPKQQMINLRFVSPLPGIGEGKPPDTKSSGSFIVKIQTGEKCNYYKPDTEMIVYDQSLTVDIMFSNPKLYHLVHECGNLTENTFTAKNIFCWASFEKEGSILSIHTANLATIQTW